MAKLELKFLGQFQILLNNVSLTGINSDKTRALLAYLAIESERPHRRETLAALLWPDVLESAARQSLSQALSNLRKVLQDNDPDCPWIKADRDNVQFNHEADYSLDVKALLAAAQSPTHAPVQVGDAARLYPGQLLKGFTIPDADGFEEWLLLMREKLQQAAIEAFDHLIRAGLTHEDYSVVIDIARRQLEIDPWREETHRTLMRAYALNGQRSEALSQFEKSRKLLAEELHIAPSAESESLLEQIKSGALKPKSRPTPTETSTRISEPTPAAPTRLIALPQMMTPFVGRERELIDLDQLLADPQARLITITGMGGMGKTRLVLQAAHGQAAQTNRFEHGVAFVSLTALSSIEQVLQAIASALRINLSNQSDPAGQLGDYLSQRSMLIILDNLEHLLAQQADAIAALLTDLMGRAQHIKILTTSREALQLQGEWVYGLTGLSAEASALFTQSARRVQASFHLQAGGQDEALVQRICQLVEGMPLGIELAASWVNVLSLAEIVEEILRGLDVLTTTKRDLSQRHRSMTAVLDQSWELLTPDERRAMARLSVFRGPFTREIAKQVADASLATLAQLVAKSLLRRTEQGRYDLHELMRQYAFAQLNASGRENTEQILRRHAEAFTNVAEHASRRLWAAESIQARQEIDGALSNIRAAWAWTSGPSGDAKLTLRMAAAMAPFWFQLPDWRENEHWLQTALAQAKPDDDLAAWARAELNFGMLIHARLDVPSALPHFQRALQAFQQLGDRWHEAWVLCQISQAQFTASNIEEGERFGQESVRLFQALNDQWATGYVLWNLGHLALLRKDYAHATRLGHESLACFERVNNQETAVLASNLLGDISFSQGDATQAERHFARSLALSDSIANRVARSWTQQKLGQVQLAQGNWSQALANFVAAFCVRDDISDHEAVADALQGMALAIAMPDLATGSSGHLENAARLLGAAALSRRGDSLLLPLALKPLYDAVRDCLSNTLTPEQIHLARTVGQRMTGKDLVKGIKS